MANVKFLLQKGKDETATIHLRFYKGRKFDLKKATHYQIKRMHWNADKQCVRSVADAKNRDKINNDLTELRATITKAYNEDYKQGKIISSLWLQGVLDRHNGQENNNDISLFTVYGLRFIDNLESPNKSTVQKYQNIINKVTKFEKHRKSKIYLTDINLTFKKDFTAYLRKVEKLSPNTIGRTFGFIKTIANDAKAEGLTVHPQLDKVKGSKKTGDFITLSEEEIKRIEIHDFKTIPYLDNARDWLVIGLWTGQRVSDLLKFTSKNINGNFIEFTQQKTGKPTIAPLHASTLEIIAKNNGQFPRKISEQRFNEYIKLVCKEVGLTQHVKGGKMNPKTKRKEFGDFPKYELVTSHICRRSFATNHYGKLPTPVIMSITNHSTEKQFLTYIGKQQKDHAETLRDYWQKEEEVKRSNVAPMKITKEA